MKSDVPEQLVVWSCPICGALGHSPAAVKMAPYAGEPYGNLCWVSSQHAEPVRTLFRRDARLTPNGDWVRRLVSEWVFDEDVNEGRSIVENDAIQAEAKP